VEERKARDDTPDAAGERGEKRELGRRSRSGREQKGWGDVGKGDSGS
jgi:hypothetical protein